MSIWFRLSQFFLNNKTVLLPSHDAKTFQAKDVFIGLNIKISTTKPFWLVMLFF